ncbi:glycoside hydrolase [candidate division WOR-1 bacterium RIFOXYA12_FULL_52_29]|uniref:Glycoside hydrolase n=1 Tax=candidate division WOR-1 bacterium RIFOXYC12_FULL_54_18 TaxID=1802584 RepID=A0A1F4T4J3_UNCSA|nr:MAG: glycoside hydrolase [candidate division WOR-1 bacterium RIFOXYA2_FULL_51_19]OGC17217.1 MAG: glycoside hydrolase [candidate division WOR-1 bacterium RIFOXYA12_FULL_52_29]OGC26077.1 MAG: glycoside hydrolase [candidate division WOR-1 bacterium RIFOXYB2_FULL_45_9]OGC27634.1 MAG: glycoside hydrolase [candidate division WOR-1 bacterium RIFOXYC12_FULL_54_18]OGC29152.1 MAG: glycoside hydrolase [candidate division WOR-1 bacterium RIFOXYB12_FULL_52_16]
MEKGYLALVLHAHLPFVRHPEHDEFLEEDWLFEAITETYIPLLKVFEGLVDDGADFRLTMSITPTLGAMLMDPLLQDRYVKHLNGLIELSGRELERTRWQPEFQALARMYHDLFIDCRDRFLNKYNRNLIYAFKKFQDLGKLEIITCGATHGFLPLMESNPNAVRAQIKVAAAHYQTMFDRRPRGIWLPECGYYPGLDEILRDEGIRFFLVDTHGILHGSPRPKYGVFAPVYCRSGVAAFGRDMESSKAVWSANEGYPGDYNYREFYRDIGFDLDYDYIRPYIHTDGTRINTGIKYYRISGRMDLSQKQPYVRQWALDRAADHAGNFLFNRAKQVEHLHDYLGRKPIVVSPYDAELYGHWWYEGPDWLNFLFRKMHYDQDVIKPITLMEYLEHNPKNQVVTPSFSSWGWKGYSEYWLEGSNDWVYRHLHKAADRMVELAKRFPDSDGILRRGLNQAARELLLAQSSDWAFIMKTGTCVSYAVKRTNDHLGRFNQIYEQINNNSLDGAWLADIEYKDNIFQQIDYRVYA